MGVIRLVAGVVYLLLLLYFLTLLVRMVLDWIPLFNRSWRPRGAGLVVAEIVYSVTDPPIRFVRRFVHPLRIGPIAVDLAFTIVFIACLVLMSIVRAL